ncbi:MAG: HAD family hydrolase [Spirochaetota bacterium]
MRYKLIVSDVDGCLAPEESAAWDLESFSRLARLVRGEGDEDHGGSPLPLTLCTGRPQPYVEVLMKLLDVRLPAICESGAVVYSLADNRSTYGPGVTQEKLDELFEIRHFVTGELLARNPEAVHQFGKEAQISVYAEDPSRIPALADEVREFCRRFEDDPVEISASHYYLNISLRGVTKGTALRQLMDSLGLHADDVAAVGDTVGDMALREEAGFFACPSNATPDIKRVADYVSPSPDVAGMLDIVERLTARGD